MDSMPPQAWPVIEQVRDGYVGYFESVIEVFSDKQLAVEVVTENPKQKPYNAGDLDLPYRFDFIVLTGNNVVHVGSPELLEFEPLSFRVDGTEVTIMPFLWDRAEISVSGGSGPVPIAVLKRWFMDAFGGVSDTADMQIRKVVHFMSSPEVGDGAFMFEVDFGTAEPEALAGLLAVLAEQKPARITVQTEW